MDSRLPKPSGLKKPTLVQKFTLPTERIKKPAFGSTQIITMANQQMQPPLTRDPLNIQNGQRRARAASPEFRATATRGSPTHTKMRRSRSACDIRAMPVLKRVASSTLPSIPAKMSRFATTSTASNLSVASSSISNGSTNGGNSKRVDTVAAKLTKPINRKPTVASAAVGRSAATTTASSAAAKKTATSVSTTGGGKSINKRIPPYDYKARYNDLLEKHKVLKEKYDVKCEQMDNLENLPEQFEESQAQLFQTKDQLKYAQSEIKGFHEQLKQETLKNDSLTQNLGKVIDELDELKKVHEKILKENKVYSVENVELRERTATLTEENAKLLQNEIEFKEREFRSNIERKELHNTIMDLRGNIRVFCRVRPQLDNEEDRLQCGWNYIDEATVEIQNPDLIAKNKPGAHVFSFDQVFHANSKQSDIFELVSPLIQSALDGYNICIFAYGQTGSGKTYTMDGVPSDAGVIPRTVDLLFDSVQNYKRLGWEYTIKVTFLEIYNEVLYDLLSNEQKDMEIRMVKNSKNDIYVSNITEETVTTAARLRQLMQIAKMNRATACTVGNERSSRSHAVTKIELIGMHAERNEISVGTINLVDLAGSESPKTSIRMNETKNINRSLSELTNVILALLQKQDHIPYRNSKLTHLLMPSLGGNSKTLMFINVAPLLDCFVESVKSLRFAASVNSCKMAKAKRNRMLNTSVSGSLEK